MLDREQYLESAGSSTRVWTPGISWPPILATLDATAILVAAASTRAIPLLFLALNAGLLMFLLLAGGVYSEKPNADVPGKVPFTLAAITLAGMGVITLNFMILRLDVTPTAVLGLWSATVGAVAAGRLVAWPIHAAMLRGEVSRKAVIVGSGVAATLLADKIARHPELGLETVGFVDDGPRRYVRGRREPLLGDLSRLSEIIESTDAKVVMFAYTRNATPDMLAALYRADPKVEVLMMPRYFEYVSTGMQVQGLAGMPLLRLNRPELGRVERVFKRAEDVIIAGLASLVALPLLPFVALAIRLDSPGPVFYSHERIGKHGKAFRMYKFRSMTDDADGDDKAFAGRLSDAKEDFAGANDGPCLLGKPVWRMTRVGKVIRSTSIDELPQLWNVLRGDMSLVGPRPPLREEVDAYEEWQKKRLSVSPGITGVWQVSGRSDLPFDEMVWLDFGYVDSWSLWLDFSILVQTVPAVLSRRGAY